MTVFDIVLLGFILGVLIKDVGPKITGHFKAKKGGQAETPIAPYIPKRTRLISHSIFTVVFIILIIQFDAVDLFTVFFIIALVIMGLTPQPHAVYEKGLRAKGQFYTWEEIEKITIPKRSALFQIKLKGTLRFNVPFSVSSDDREKLINALQEKPVTLETGK